MMTPGWARMIFIIRSHVKYVSRAILKRRSLYSKSSLNFKIEFPRNRTKILISPESALFADIRDVSFLFRIWLSRRCLMCSEPLFIPNFELFKIHYFHSHFLASRGPDYFLFLISICFETAFYS